MHDRNFTARRRRRGGWGRIVALAVAGALSCAACHDATPGAGAGLTAGPARRAPAPGAPADDGVVLTPQQIGKLGLVTQPASPVDYREESSGYGVVLGHEIIAQSVAELLSAQATARQSRAALERARRLSGTPGAVSADVEESAAQKAAVDAAALTLTREKLSSTLGMDPPWREEIGGRTLQDLASGRLKLLRATFPLGTLPGGRPTSLRAARLGTAPPPGGGWTLRSLWDAPADVNIPGRSFFALLAGSDAGEGERLRVWAPVGAAEAGVRVPSAAAVLRDGRYWCYVEKKPGTFVRIEIDIGRPLTDGYFVSTGVAAGDAVVTTAAGLLLAKETGAGAEPD